MTARSSPLARTVDLDRVRNATERQVAARFHPGYRSALARLPAGREVFHGLPFELGPGSDAPRWILLDGTVNVELPEGGPASRVVVAHGCDTWRDDGGGRPVGAHVAGLLSGRIIPTAARASLP